MKEMSNKKKYIIIGAICVLVIAIIGCIIGFAVASKANKENTSISSESSESSEASQSEEDGTSTSSSADQSEGAADESKDSSTNPDKQNSSNSNTTSNKNTSSGQGGYFDREAAKWTWAQVNAERTAAGLQALTWDENIYQFACKRAKQIINDYSHNGRGEYGENITEAYDAYDCHSLWRNSSGHYKNYMSSNYVSGACAIYVDERGLVHAVENFKASGPVVLPNGQVQGVIYPDDPSTYDRTWTASNGVKIFIKGEDAVSNHPDPNAAAEALLEWINSGRP